MSLSFTLVYRASSAGFLFSFLLVIMVPKHSYYNQNLLMTFLHSIFDSYSSSSNVFINAPSYFFLSCMVNPGWKVNSFKADCLRLICVYFLQLSSLHTLPLLNATVTPTMTSTSEVKVTYRASVSNPSSRCVSVTGNTYGINKSLHPVLLCISMWDV